MTSKLVPSDPASVMVIRDVVPRIVTTLSVPFWRFGRVKIGGRGTIVRLESGALAVFSPVALTEDVKRKVSEMGEVKYIAALDNEHHIFLGPWHTEYPNAQVMGPEMLPEKRAKQNNENVPFSVLFSASKPVTSISPEFDAEFDWEYVPSHVNKELVFHHRPTRSLILADLMFNLPATEQFSKSGVEPNTGILSKIFNTLQSTKGDAKWQQRTIWYGTSAKDRNGFSKSMEKIDKWEFERIIPCHGDVIEGEGKGIFEKVMRWHLDAAKGQGKTS
ncbi:hypothetical protein COCC4DRAFT_72606 [Bipolaris maydis ATCC 48331]|uniref:DUF4336 domain-containing protein n=2 Tax=Cochliobolus heterostrophus TaxID=5016 RepID=M2UYH8_COCH5|nr:uncharacterized protein COCC4DRAFT_72606 [Bipolaris maydis ATCC 48331]EMD92807.1 hypothetical protein COCHEDRAFT_1172330 [Bipolaris maydis C5]KAH7558892.1 hypothetical protein BM1_05029 [Bipolaris maydis]ENI04804.1 hypothetical protein COCC4DRAFT_72606 [Bipolaris maydis ATCC 48331]KAJ5026106.1 hypothetical protein J3E73DRAFT_313275 [Bipolaris maydis]KAJ5056643.1 hypothetical protein J3E74DRAFT_374218 [Bipolaris maydis]